MSVFSPFARRYFLNDMASGLGAMALGGLMSSPVRASDRTTDPLALQPPHFEGKAKAVIHLFMAGAPSQLELFDNKPMLTELSGKPLPPLNCLAANPPTPPAWPHIFANLPNR